MEILIVDDDFVSRKKMSVIMSQYGRCDTVTSGAECMDAFIHAHTEGAPYSIIFMDVQMEGMDGIETMAKIREWEESHDIILGTGAKIIMMTVKKDPQTFFSSFRQGCEAYITKPFNNESVVKAMDGLGQSFNLKVKTL